MPNVGQGRVSLASGGTGYDFGIAVRDGANAAVTTTLATGTYASVVSTSTALPTANFDSGVTYDGNTEWTIGKTGTYSVNIEGLICVHAGISGTVGVTWTWGKWNGSSFVAQTDDEVADTLYNKNLNPNSNATPWGSITITGLSLVAGDKINWMIDRTSGTQDLSLRGFSISIVEEQS